MMTIKKLAMQLCLSSAVIAAMPAFAAEVGSIKRTTLYGEKTSILATYLLKPSYRLPQKQLSKRLPKRKVIASTPNADSG